ncbi:PREDICTED: uncharacterized protein LOC109183739 isoform X5 [Ipomoea nil]|uniref:uncharacterized protein LOC109183739 isoform X5 n=1 Tax=Ipomoea nil TaxID=35883 RepID=UPI000900E9E6|nr:PREDICTED: uncharacterized protein LOC109183739 isoform X5 [Ipomoea nil]
MVERFFPLPNPTDMSSCRSHSDDPIILLSGPPSSGKTSLLFQYALNSAMEFNGAVVFICSRHKLDTKPPFLSQGVDPSSDIFQRIHIKNCQQRYNNARGRDLAMVRTLALCRNAIDTANYDDTGNRESSPCQLLLSDTHHGDSPRLLYIYKRWVSSIYTIKGDGFGSFLLRKSNYFGIGKSDGITTAKYSIALQYLVLEGITEDGEQ